MAYFCKMIYPANFEQKLGFDKIRAMVALHCLTPLSEKMVKNIHFSTDFAEIQKNLTLTWEFRNLIFMESGFPLYSYFDLSDELTHLKVEGTYIEQENLFELKSALIIAKECLYFLNGHSEKYPNLHKLVEPVNLDKSLISNIEKIIDDKGEIKDSASEKLTELRKTIIRKKASIISLINQAFRNAKKSGWILKDAEITIRNGRAVIPILAANKRSIKGYIHDESATGQTVFLEPVEVFEANNDILDLENEERREIIRILKAFSDQIRPEIPALLIVFEFLAVLDFIRAKARVAIEINGVLPKLDIGRLISWQKAVHPLLYLSHKANQKTVIPLDIDLNENHRILIISGPNAGGKSVCLKTVGLLQYMLQCGLLVPLSENSESGIFNKIFLDIGDEQSLENDLSTYSSHLINIKTFIEIADNSSLFLIDEFGAGTEPQFGGAIAEASLEKLNSKNAYGVVTTHYSNLKLLPDSQKGIVNGAMLYDTKKMQPLFQLKIGQPGSSFAFEIAKKIGFDESVLSEAEKKTGTSQLDFEKQLLDLEMERKEVAKLKIQQKVADDFLSEMIDKYEKLRNDQESKKHELIFNAKKEAKQILENANKLIENTIREIKENLADKSKTQEIRQNFDNTKNKILSEELSPKPIKKIPELIDYKPINAEIVVDESQIEIGDSVRIKGAITLAKVIEIRGKSVIIESNSIHLKSDLNNLEKISGVLPSPKKSYQSKFKTVIQNINDKMAYFRHTMDVRGKRVEEVIPMIQTQIDDAVLLSISEFRILHGTGHGILRQAIREFLSGIPEVKSFNDEHVERGGQGITIVNLK